MKTLRVVIFIVVALIQLSVPASVVWKRERTLKHGRAWKFRTAPVDPVDAIRGRYVSLRFAAEEIPSNDEAFRKLESRTTLYFVLKEDTDGFATVERISEKALSGDNVITGQSGYWSEQTLHVHFPFDRFWVTEKSAPAAEKAYLENSRRGKQNAHVTVRVRDGDATIEQLFIDGQPLADYLRANPPQKP
jgi:uncharacterized membrane-anchored protein